MTAGCGDAHALCEEGDGRWEYLSTWATAGAASVPCLRRGKQAAALLEKGRVEDFSVSTCTHQYEPLRAAVKFPSFLPRCSLLKNAFRYMTGYSFVLTKPTDTCLKGDFMLGNLAVE